MSSHIFFAPPVVGTNISLQFSHFGHTKPLIFSITPKTFVFVFLQKLISFLTSLRDTSYGVVTIIAPNKLAFFKYYITEICSSEVPGGVSTIR